MIERIKRIIFLHFVFFPACSLNAQQFWLQPEKFICKRAETINIRFRVGENFEGHNWGGNASRVNSLIFYMGSLKDDLSNFLSLQKGDSLQLAMFDEGTAMVTFHSTNTFVKMDASDFNEYLINESLHDVVAYRKAHHQSEDDGKEYFRRSVKTIVQVGAKMNACYKQLTSLPLDIIAQSNPYALKSGRLLRIKIFFHRQPLVNHDIRIWHRVKSKTVIKHLTTNSKGEISVRLLKTGRWMVSTVTMNHLENNPDADWQSYWGSLTWGYSR